MIRLTKPATGGASADLKSILEKGLLVQGENVEHLEASVSAYVGRSHGVAVNSGTSAIQCALMALGIGAGDEVLVPDFTFPATANAVVCAGATPVLVDIDARTFNIDVRDAASRVTGKTKAIMPVDLFGLPAQLEEIAGFSERHGLALVEDAACALGSALNGRRCGSFGQASIISFHPRKIVTTGEGGMVLTDTTDVAQAVSRLRNHGIETSPDGAKFVLAGYNMRMNELEACIGAAQMARIDDLIEDRRGIASSYDELLTGIDEIRPPVEPEGTFHTYQSYVIMLGERIDRDRLIAAMKHEGVETSIGTYAIHVQPFYRKRLGHEPGSLPMSFRAYRRSLSLPIYASMDEPTVRKVVASLKKCIHRAIAGK
jgi:dTDP-4-amino-4,6-dideoxygalactose transaminase